MKYFYDTEFLEGTQKKWFGNTKPTIDLISIGIVSEDNREYYAISKDFNLYEAWNRLEMKYDDQLPPIKNRQMGYSGYLAEEAIFRAIPKKVYWIRENVLNPIFMELQQKEREYLDKQKRIIGYAPSINSEWSYSNFKRLVKKFGKSNKQITKEVAEFCNCSCIFSEKGEMSCSSNDKFYSGLKTSFYSYYGAYDHVALCWLFGKMIDLPKGFPMYTIDLKQMLDEKAESKEWYYGRDIWNNSKNRSTDLQEKDQPASLEEKIGKLKRHDDYPKQTNEHNALADAKWNKELYEFLKDFAQ